VYSTARAVRIMLFMVLLLLVDQAGHAR
jgi:hypothetical protein